MFIRSRLVLLVLAWALPAVAALLFILTLTARSEQQANERALRDKARAMAMVVERELDRRATVARVLATSGALKELPQWQGHNDAWFRHQAVEAMKGMQGWVEVRTAQGVLFDSRSAALVPSAARPLQPSVHASALLTEEETEPHAVLLHPVRQADALVANIAVVVLPAELQRLVDAHELPAGWVSTVIDAQQRVVARQPGGAVWLGRPATADLRETLSTRREGAFQSRSLDGVAVNGYFSTAQHGWTYIAAMPRPQFGGYFEQTSGRIAVGALLLLALAVGGALWVSSGIARAVVSLKDMAAQLQSGKTVTLRPTGIAECDDVAATLASASQATQSARAELEHQVAEAVKRTREAEQQAARSQRVAALGRLTGGVAHDFNNLLGVVSNSAHLVARHAADKPQLQSSVAVIQRAVEAGSRLTQQLMRFAARRPVLPQILDPCRFIPELEELLHNVVGKRIAVELYCAPDTRKVVMDATEFELAILNLALNARDAMPEGGKLRVSALNASPRQTEGLPPGDYVAIEVADEGHGMDASIAERVFEPFVTTKPVGEGTGLGLAQVHGFSKQAGGAVRVQSAPGQGTTVTMLLPAGGRTALPDAAPRKALSTDALQGLRVAVVEDNDALGEATAALLQSYGADVTRLRDAAQAVQALDAGQRFDVVLSDVMMPGELDGFGLAQALRARRPAVPVVLISGYHHARTPVADDMVVLQKPAREEDLVNALLQAGRAQPARG